MNITLDLYHPVEMRAFAAFLNAVADSHESSLKGSTVLGYGSLGGQSPEKAYSGFKGDDPLPDSVTHVGVESVARVVGGEAQANTNTAPTRKRGEPSPGHKRRTKAEIAEDEAAEKANAAGIVTGTDTPAAISTGGERVAPDDEPEVEQQDVVDEADETAKAGAELSHDDVRNAMGQYVTKFGMDAAQIDIPKVFQLALKDTAVTKVSLIPGDQASLKKAVDGVMEMLTKNPFSRDAVA